MSKVVMKEHLRNELTNSKQSHSVLTDVGKDVGGLEESFSPVELLADTFASCALSIMGLIGGKMGYSFVGAYAEVATDVSSEEFRVKEIKIDFHLPKDVKEEDRKEIETLLHEKCVVGRSLNADLKQTATFTYDV
ncbi:MAG: OsmC family protein [Veillonella sp.]|uniref:OsmC family protein n=1 Tax=Veillonella sp. TaxID=1926307 RepID=UPI0025E84C27|nr:OsmC family protein [Veillonella sp.]MBS4914071.1 OsmC family protein [Veillonella sp.]